MVTNGQCAVIMENLARIQSELVASIVGETAAAAAMAAADASSMADTLATLQTAYDASPSTFVDTQQNIDDLDTVRLAYEAVTLDPVTDISDAVDALIGSVTP